MEVKREWFDKDYYHVLGVASSASEKEIQQAYRKLARELHPDANPGDGKAEDQFKEISAAYEVIGEPKTRTKYDEARAMGPVGGIPMSGGGGPGGFSFNIGDMGDLNDLIGGMFGGGVPFSGDEGGTRPRRGSDQETQLRLSFDEAVEGVTTSVTIGDGSNGATRTIKVRIPAGVNDGQRIRLKDKGGRGSGGGPNGDLYVEVLLNDHPVFGRDGLNLTLALPVTFEEAALGADIKVPSYRGDSVKLRLPPGTQPGRTFRVKGGGILNSSGVGDLLVTVEIAIPTNLSKVQRQALETFAEGTSDSPRAHLDF